MKRTPPLLLAILLLLWGCQPAEEAESTEKTDATPPPTSSPADSDKSTPADTSQIAEESSTEPVNQLPAELDQTQSDLAVQILDYLEKKYSEPFRLISLSEKNWPALAYDYALVEPLEAEYWMSFEVRRVEEKGKLVFKDNYGCYLLGPVLQEQTDKLLRQQFEHSLTNVQLDPEAYFDFEIEEDSSRKVLMADLLQEVDYFATVLVSPAEGQNLTEGIQNFKEEMAKQYPTGSFVLFAYDPQTFEIIGRDLEQYGISEVLNQLENKYRPGLIHQERVDWAPAEKTPAESSN